MSLPNSIDRLTSTYKRLLAHCVEALKPGVPDADRAALAADLQKVIDHDPKKEGKPRETRMEG